MSTNCNDLIAMSIESDICDSPIVKGVGRKGVIVNFEDIDKAAVLMDASSKSIIRQLTLKTGKKGYAIECATKNPFEGTQTTFAEGAIRNKFNHDVVFKILDDGPDVREGIVDKLANGKFVIVIENEYKGEAKTKSGSAAFQIFGYHQGLQASAMTSDKYNEDTDGGWDVTMSETGAPKSGMYLFDTDYATSAALVEALKTATV